MLSEVNENISGLPSCRGCLTQIFFHSGKLRFDLLHFRVQRGTERLQGLVLGSQML